MTTFQNPSQDVIADYLKMPKPLLLLVYHIVKIVQLMVFQKSCKKLAIRLFLSIQDQQDRKFLNEIAYARLQDVPVHIDIVDVFRRSEFLPEVAKDFIETDADIFWAQLGLESQEAADILQAAGRDKIVMNKCIKIEHQGL